MVRGLVAAALTFAIYLGAQATLFHAVRIRRKLSVMLALWVVGGAVYAGFFALLPDDAAYLPRPLVAPSDAVTWSSGLFVYWSLFSGYYQFFNMADNSVGVRSLIELTRGPEGGMTLVELKRVYPYDAMLGRRLERLVEAGFLERAGGRYRCAPKGAAAARTVGALKAFLRLGPGG
ncbi:MAG TPA: hypothetical protein VNU02_21365 [Candidatus Dormibacteraeota bacterium]|nr:hypothetical protein [Candidatus Dormibacteraeota bacterium]